jgi:hypothetical protein
VEFCRIRSIAGTVASNHQVPALILELAAFLRAPAGEAIAANAVVTARATELGQLRHAQRASVHQVLREYRALRTVIAQRSALPNAPKVDSGGSLSPRSDWLGAERRACRRMAPAA